MLLFSVPHSEKPSSPASSPAISWHLLPWHDAESGIEVTVGRAVTWHGISCHASYTPQLCPPPMPAAHHQRVFWFGFVLTFWLYNMWDLSSLTRDQTHAPFIVSEQS